MKLSIMTVIVAMAASALGNKPKDPNPVTNCKQVTDKINDCMVDKNFWGFVCERQVKLGKDNLKDCCRKSGCGVSESFGLRNCHTECAP
ncbi:hypothetical protein T440DRAFT_520231 [Plenodomus tracheiphilus IPT5]|uniref:Extracellular membrane protein CFEM domain-containing protein n=1 Tax=Plenodomus tracheiphilus IPT5 TaxID=1408161 RepID=A0A6A7AZ08_9PLEO|nr:hypothetical protein T440DRAFT_520231 [Plenodomus tracheiphilus IPT5]